ncbi:uncharacterized protein LOC129608058 [Condylostylus longicornis]|uniref:uncharacterized protein LOC129608058 n=1 Tax=Condylostylus longicornis TaxID=2530218 RepID=UPI00244E1144|nr:uncharacterized protein LOC129608058 [Condylostylus longicornis]
MQPLKRFTQCGSLTMLFVVFIVLFGVSSTALTTFGKTNPNLQQPTQPPAAKGRECNTHADCLTMEGTSCVKDLNDGKLRCVCGDNLAPVNGKCSANKKGLYHMCKQVFDCDEFMVCEEVKIPFNSNNATTYKICRCDEDNDHYENKEDNTCSKGITIGHSYALLLTVIAIIFKCR